jgi:hypothetical protein
MLEELGVTKEEVDDVLDDYRVGLLKKILKGGHPLFEDEGSVPA